MWDQGSREWDQGSEGWDRDHHFFYGSRIRLYHSCGIRGSGTKNLSPFWNQGSEIWVQKSDQGRKNIPRHNTELVERHGLGPGSLVGNRVGPGEGESCNWLVVLAGVSYPPVVLASCQDSVGVSRSAIAWFLGQSSFNIRFFQGSETMGAFFWDYSGYPYSGLGITEYTEFQFPKERLFILKTEYSWRR